MKVYIGADHGGYKLKEKLKNEFGGEDFQLVDMGAKILKQEDDYPEFAKKVCLKVREEEDSFGVLICRSGIGMSIAANKMSGIRAGLCTNMGQTVKCRAHNNCNILVLAADFTEDSKAVGFMRTFLAGSFSEEERHKRRIKKAEALKEV